MAYIPVAAAPNWLFFFGFVESTKYLYRGDARVSCCCYGCRQRWKTKLPLSECVDLFFFFYPKNLVIWILGNRKKPHETHILLLFSTCRSWVWATTTTKKKRHCSMTELNIYTHGWQSSLMCMAVYLWNCTASAREIQCMGHVHMTTHL